MKRVLAVDDDHDVLFALQAISEVGDFELTTLDSGIKALELLQQERFDLVIVDYYMPEMNGMELVERIRRLTSIVPILVLTVDESLDIADGFMDAGATDFATKPIRVADLISRIHVHLAASSSKRAKWADGRDLPKGMSSMTLQLVADHLEKAEYPEDIDSISAKTGLAYQTVHRYLSFLEKEGVAGVDLAYGKVGRPINRYFWVR